MDGATRALEARHIVAPEGARRRAGLLCLALVLTIGALWTLSAALLDRFPLHVALAGNATTLTVTVDGHSQQAPLIAPVINVRFPAPPAHQREYQIDGSDSTNNFTFDPAYFATESRSPYYRFQAWLRNDGTFSRWRQLVIRDQAGKYLVVQSQPANDLAFPLPPTWTMTAQLQRMEIPRTIELRDVQGDSVQIVIDRNDRYIHIIAVNAAGIEQQLATRYFPLSWQPAGAEVAFLLMRAVAVALAALLGVTVAGVVLPAWRLPLGARSVSFIGAAATLLALGGACFTTVVLFDRAPHILDAVSYYWQGRIFAGGALSAPAPPVPAAFPTPFFVALAGRWFSQYPPGTSLLLAAGWRVGFPWLVEPLLAAGATLLTFAAARRQFGASTAAGGAVLMATSPFLLLQAGTFLSHVPAMCALALALFAATRYLERPDRRWIALGAAALGFAFLCREIAAVLYGVALFPFVLWRTSRRGPDLARDIATAAACLGLFLVVYLLYNGALTGNPLVLPRNLFNPTDKYGFGTGIGFYGQHTLGAGLVNTDELLTSLSFTLFGWPFYFSLALMVMPFLARRPAPWDVLHGAVVALFVLAYVGYFYHGIAFGPRYYFESLPSMVILTARGFHALACRADTTLRGWGRRNAGPRAQSAALALFAALLACNLVYFLPRQVALYQGYSGMPGGGGPALGPFIREGVAGRVSTLRQALVTTDNWWYYTVYLAALNCPRLDCGTVFAFAPDAATVAAIRAAYPQRVWYQMAEDNGTLTVTPGEGS